METLARLAFASGLTLLGLALITNFRGVVDWHMRESVAVSESVFGPRRQRMRRDGKEVRVFFHVIDRVLGLVAVVGGAGLLWKVIQTL